MHPHSLRNCRDTSYANLFNFFFFVLVSIFLPTFTFYIAPKNWVLSLISDFNCGTGRDQIPSPPKIHQVSCTSPSSM